MDPRSLLILGVVAIVLIGVSVVVLAPKPEGLKPPVGSWSFDAHCAWPNPCSHYNVTYDFPVSSGMGSKGSYNITFKVVDLAWTTTGVELHRLNVTFQTPSGVGVYNESFVANTHLSAGQIWEPSYGEFSFTDAQLGLGPAQNVTLSASITAEFDEISVIFGNHYSKSERTSNIGIQIHSSTVPPPQSATEGLGFSWTPVIALILLGSFLWVLSGIARMFMSLPRPTSFGSGFRDPSSGRFVGFGAAILAFATVAITVFFWIMSSLGTPDHVIAYGELIFGGLTGNFPLSAGLSVANYSVGTLLHLRH
jgi:hypothetical protein